MNTKQQLGNSIDNNEVVSPNGYSKEFREPVIEVFNSGVYSTMAEYNG